MNTSILHFLSTSATLRIRAARPGMLFARLGRLRLALTWSVAP